PQMPEGPEKLEIEHRRATQPRLIVGVGLAVLASLILFGTQTLLNWLVFGVLLTIATLLIVTGRARRIWISFDPARGTVESSPRGRRIEGLDHVELAVR